ncbi:MULTISPECIES: GlxA family transcriptional regulator [Nocardiopsis]|uniref:Transcriptional regulator, AraC family n=1 Tax=Nocardiopsis dassonvillei (strain ATCC 23218 / DSM 43111 / CIP 107115 / JCM 7437 / KCTC 9190 / NBRC 14626 / NCTC 10488 / NRRL B-5397 / IMRU 509) TaxID=446468 RepID=D7B797_NOCDD|nr:MULTISPECIES: GlxA family transcriptional regulator [Nocardiopsis]ADH67469.1 transcriptional regulator, AraC family [Nocardiopsis dassonvillei subsp. dassonvillei DSM 43111]APC35670.1 AraC family transcriptional regulator [Nocardiopsis dassonvillei]NKY80839.1 GlxA family transcriptional regulator [Nocardiopsis dassonvillei]VEI87693.1 Right origin-binding protein [Nocardiopsis dassonvillei]
MSLPHRVVIGVFPDVDLLDVTGPAEVFALANQEAPGRADYRVLLAGPTRGEVRTSAGVRLLTDVSFDDVGGQVDTLLVPGAVDMGDDGPVARIDSDVVAWVRETAPCARRVASVCVGAHVLAAAGLLDGRTATTHWSTAAQLAADHPAVTVDPDPIFVRADRGRLWTGAGISACLDLALALVAEDLGEDVALAVARQLVMYLKRQSGQSQFSVPLSRPASARRDIDELLLWISDHLDEDLSAEVLAARMHLSERHFARVFAQETGTGPAAYVEGVRVEAARRLLETTDDPLDRVAARAGFGSTETLHRAFRRQLATTPAAYRRRFRTQAA